MRTRIAALGFSLIATGAPVMLPTSAQAQALSTLTQNSATPAQAARTLNLATLQQQATQHDPRSRQLQLESDRTQLRIRSLEVERRPTISLDGLTQYQSDVPEAPFTQPNGQSLFSPPHLTLDSSLRVNQRINDPTIVPRLAIERAQLEENQARIRTAVFNLRREVNEAFFTALLTQEQQATVASAIADLDARLREVSVRVRDGAAVPTEASAIQATLLQRQQDAAELSAHRRAALLRLTALTGEPIADADVLALPTFGDEVSQVRSRMATLTSRPEYQQFARTRERLDRQIDLVGAQQKPQFSVFGRVGYGRPGLNFISDTFEAYAVTGFQLQWKLSTWGTPERERQALKTQQDILSADEAAFRQSLDRSIQNDLADFDRLTSTLVVDDQIIELREGILRTADARLRENVITASEYVDRSTELVQAQFAKSTHHVERARSGVNILTTLGQEVP